MDTMSCYQACSQMITNLTLVTANSCRMSNSHVIGHVCLSAFQSECLCGNLLAA